MQHQNQRTMQPRRFCANRTLVLIRTLVLRNANSRATSRTYAYAYTYARIRTLACSQAMIKSTAEYYTRDSTLVLFSGMIIPCYTARMLAIVLAVAHIGAMFKR